MDRRVLRGGTARRAGDRILRLPASGPHRREIKKLWVSPDFRGMDVANRLMAHVEQQAARDGFTRALLDTSDLLTHAVGLYEHRGYHRIDRYNDNPYATLFFAKALGTAPGR